MRSERLPNGREFISRVQSVSGVLSLGSVALISAYLIALLQLTALQWWGFVEITGGLFVVLFVAQAKVHGGLWQPLVHYLDRHAAGTATPDEARAAFASAANLPVGFFRWGAAWWLGGGLLVAGTMLLRFDTMSAFSAAVMIFAAVSGGFVMMVVHYFVMKRNLRPIREALAREIPNPFERGELVTQVSLSRKLMVSVTGVMVVVVVFAVFLAQARSGRDIESNAIDLQRRWLDRVVRAGVDADALDDALADARALGLVDALGVLAPDGESVALGRLDPVSDAELASIRAVGGETGDSMGFDSPNVISWRRAPDGRIWVAVTLWERVRTKTLGDGFVYAALIVGAAAIAFLLAYLLARDVSGATGALRVEAERLASGDLRPGRTFESEDELGELSRSFEMMALSLRGIVSGVASAADRVESTASELASVSDDLSSASVDQMRGLEQASGAMVAIDSQVRGIADSSQALNSSVEESSSSILELGASGRDLNDTATTLSGRVDEVSASIEEMVASVQQVVATTESLSHVSEETSSSMEEMASSLREVDAIAEQTARLSQQVVETAETGREKVSQTIAGMDAIRAATEAAEQVIRSLGGRTREIGAIVDVIDDVADETNLLALNAAIIAAQSGEQGRAFSVVADEIKDLAERVLASTKEIAELIGSVQREADNAIGAIEAGTSSVASGVELSAEAGQSLEAITSASRDSGARIQGIVAAVREQSRAAGHVVELMDRVRSAVEEIRSAAGNQERGNEVMVRSAMTMRDVSRQVRGTTEEQARGSGRILDSVEEVRGAVERINDALQEQSASCRSAAESLESVVGRTRANEESAEQMDAATKGLLQQSATLRDNIRRFRI